MITALKEVGQTHNIQIIAVYEGDIASVTVILTPKKQKEDDETIIQPLHVKGPIAEVEAYLAENLGKGVASTSELTTNIGTLQEQKEKLEADIKAAEQKLKQAEAKVETAKAAKKKESTPAPAEPAKTEGKLDEVKPAYRAKKAQAPATPPATTPPETSASPAPTAGAVIETHAHPTPTTDVSNDDLFAELQALGIEGGQP